MLFVPMYLCLSFTQDPNFVQTSTLTQERFLNRYDPITWPPDPGVPQAPKPNQITVEKTLLYKKCIKFFPGSAGPWLASIYLLLSIYIYIYKMGCLYLPFWLCLSFEPPHPYSPNFVQTSTPTQGRFLTQVWTTR